MADYYDDARLKAREGFTLLELLIGMGMFVIIATIAVGGFAHTLKTQRQAAGLIAVNSSMSLTIEQMIREVRTGYDFCVRGQDCLGESELSFRNAENNVVTYCLHDGAIRRGTGGGVCGGSGFRNITASHVLIHSLSFAVSGNDASDGLPPRITVSLGMSAREASIKDIVVSLQTTVSARVLDG